MNSDRDSWRGSPRLLQALALLGAFALVLAVAACGSSSSSASKATTRAGGAFAARRAAIATCLKKQGITLPQRPPATALPIAAGRRLAAGPGWTVRRRRAKTRARGEVPGCDAQVRPRPRRAGEVLHYPGWEERSERVRGVRAEERLSPAGAEHLRQWAGLRSEQGQSQRSEADSRGEVPAPPPAAPLRPGRARWSARRADAVAGPTSGGRGHDGLIPPSDPFTFAVVGHDEAATLSGVLDQAFAAAAPGDEVWLVDSASVDDSARIAASLGAKVVTAPLGKGRAIATALERCPDGYLCLVDADIQYSSGNIPLQLREAAAATEADMVVGDFDQPPGTRRSVTPAIYRPLVAALFPEAHRLDMPTPLSGFRVLRGGTRVGALPPGYGVEAHLNVEVAATGGRIALCSLGDHRGPSRGHMRVASIGAEVATAILDLAEVHGRLDPIARPCWDEWIEAVLDVTREQPAEGADDDEYQRRLLTAAERPFPPRRIPPQTT